MNTNVETVKETREKANYKELLGKLGPLLALIVLVVFVSVLSPDFLSLSNLMNLMRQVSINALIAFGMTFVIITGGIDLSVGSTLALTGAIIGGLIAGGTDPIIAMIIGVLLGFFLGAVNGLLITKGKIVPFIATLATMTIYRGATLVYTDGKPITGLDTTFLFQFMGRGYFYGIPFPIVITLLIFAILFVVLHKTAFGRKVFAIGGNEKAAIIAGIKNARVKMIVYGISGTLSAIAGIILTSRLNSAQPTAGTSYEMDAIASVVLGGTSMSGGRGRIFGTLVGALIIGTLNNGLNLLGVSTFYQQIVKGIVIIIAVLIDRKK
ncbi:ribose ABC transporter permease [Aerococcus agrisoli]|uniref:Ribose ABC transporter permease n=1 Tax=Aerococcus agrisoli TaxID=2487350 RepID=A0A3N4G6E5_9LACT|nr:ribose ABC transporter permease [Aerococcus agrisoli]RPA56957.1 ribose ABC transporter permease [Aerococcus agrisoli]